MLWWSKKQELDIVKEAIKQEKESPKTYFMFGFTDNNRVVFQSRYDEVSMGKAGCQELIDQITYYMNQLKDDKSEP